MHGGASALLHDQRGGSVHGGRTYWRILRAAATAAKWHNSEWHMCKAPQLQHASARRALPMWDAAMPELEIFFFHWGAERHPNPAFDSLRLVAGSVHGTNDYMRWVGRSQEERCEQRKAARLCLDTSAHAGTEFQRLMTVLSNVSRESDGCEVSVNQQLWAKQPPSCSIGAS